MANLNPVVRRGRNVLIGASAMMFTDQMAVDIYFDDFWDGEGPLMWVAVVCVGWGMLIALVQHVAQRAGPWEFDDMLLHQIAVQDIGIHPFNPPGPLPNVPVGQPLPAVGGYIVNGHAVQGLHIPWHHRVELRRSAPGNPPLHYNQHLPRKGRRAEPPAIKPGGSHRVFSTITYSTQVQNFRRIKEVPSADEENA
ncbi:hypothetical protein TRAPUB_10211 [Trametes pubescens]|uniref:Uncharacterized protein n=1 Tax=Trametes pubescens TaxID=154538 RepID=A0A1M2W0C5_TRAPU|nr:hypothetical protein TRAPUB_10211 [Trametes pubescens]